MRLTVLPRVAAVAIALAGAGPASAESVVVTAARMLDVDKGAIVSDPVIVVTDGRIAAVAALSRAAVR